MSTKDRISALANKVAKAKKTANGAHREGLGMAVDGLQMALDDRSIREHHGTLRRCMTALEEVMYDIAGGEDSGGDYFQY